MATSGINKWARGWLAEVDEARKALDRIARIQELRREQPELVRDPLGSVGERSEDGITHVMDNVGDTEGDPAKSAYDWACDVLVLFDMMEQANRPLLRGQLLSGLDVAYMKFRLGTSEAEIGRSFRMSKSAIREDLRAFEDYLDMIGPMKAFHAGADELVEMVGPGAGLKDTIDSPEEADKKK